MYDDQRDSYFSNKLYWQRHDEQRQRDRDRALDRALGNFLFGR